MFRFRRDRYDPKEVLAAFDRAEQRLESGVLYFVFDMQDEIELHYPSCSSPPVPEHLLALSRSACADIGNLDNLVQSHLEREAQRSSSGPQEYMFHIGYLEVGPNSLRIRYWGERVNTEWEAEFVWLEVEQRFVPSNF